MREANENLQNFSYMAAHDLRSPLRSIGSYSMALAEDYGPALNTAGRSYLDKVISSVQKMERLLNDLLEYSRISQAELQLEPVALQRAVNDALSLLQADIQAKERSVSVGDGLPIILGHPATVVLLIQNLVSNALKFTPPGIQPQIQISADETPAVAAAPEASDGLPTAGAAQPNRTSAGVFIRLRVQDNGIGIADDDVKKLFSAFQRLHRAEIFPGTGLGLAIVRKGAERMGGRVGVVSQPGRGSCFWIDLPAGPR